MICGKRAVQIGKFGRFMMFSSIYYNKRVLITGNTGFKGAWLTIWLLKLGAEVYGYAKDVPTKTSLFEELNLDSMVNHLYGDIRDLPKLSKYIDEIKPHFIFHLAAQPIVANSYENPLETFETNVLGSAILLEAYRRLKSKAVLVFITSDKCYENVEWTYGYRENDRLGGKDPYSASKAGAELVFSSYYRSFFKGDRNKLLSSARAGNVIGGGDWADNRIVPDTMVNWAKGEAVEIRSPNATRPWQHVLEPLSGYLRLGQLLWQDGFQHVGQSFNFGPASNQNHTVVQLLSELGEHWRILNSSIRTEILLKNVESFTEANLLKLNCDKSLHEIAWEPVLNFEKTSKYTADWYYEFYFNKKSGLSLFEFTNKQILDFEKTAIQKSLSWTKGI